MLLIFCVSAIDAQIVCFNLNECIQLVHKVLEGAADNFQHRWICPCRPDCIKRVQIEQHLVALRVILIVLVDGEEVFVVGLASARVAFGYLGRGVLWETFFVYLIRRNVVSLYEVIIAFKCYTLLF